MLPYSATDALNSMNTAYGITIDAIQTPDRKRSPRLLRWLRSLAHLA